MSGSNSYLSNFGYSGGGIHGNLLNLSAYKLNSELVRNFLQLGCPIDCTDYENNTALHLAFSTFNKDPVAAKNICENLVKI